MVLIRPTLLAVSALLLGALLPAGVASVPPITEFAGGVGTLTVIFDTAGTETPSNVPLPVPTAVRDARFLIRSEPRTPGGADYPVAPSVDVGADGDIDWEFRGPGYGAFGRQDRFEDDAAQLALNATGSGPGSMNSSLLLPDGASVGSAWIRLSANSTSPSIQIGNTTLWSSAGATMASNLSVNATTGIIAALAGATSSPADGFGIILRRLAVALTTAGAGTLTIEGFSIEYAVTLAATTTPRGSLAAEFDEKVPKTGTGAVAVPIKIQVASAGILVLTGLNIVLDVPPSPLAGNPSVSLTEDTVASGALDLRGILADDWTGGDALTFQVVPTAGPLAGGVGVTVSGWNLTVDAATGARNDNWTGVFVVRVVATDGSGLVGTSAPITITVVAVDDPPVFETEPPTRTVRAGEGFLYVPRVAEGDGEAVGFTLPRGPAGMRVGPADGLLTWDVPRTATGDHPVSIRATDTNGSWGEQNFTITVLPPLAVNDRPPEFISVPPPLDLDLRVGDSFHWLLDATDPDGDPVAYLLVVGPPAFRVDDRTGDVFWSPQTAGTVAVVVAVTDGILTTEQRFNLTVTVNRPPTTPAGGTIPGSVDLPLVTNLTAMTGDEDGDRLRFRARELPGDAVLTEDGRLFWIPRIAGMFNVSFTVSDGRVEVVGAVSFIIAEQAASMPVFSGLMATYVGPGEAGGPGLRIAGRLDGDFVLATWRVDGGPWMVDPVRSGSWDATTALRLEPGLHRIEFRALDRRGREAREVLELKVPGSDDRTGALKAPDPFFCAFVVAGLVVTVAIGLLAGRAGLGLTTVQGRVSRRRRS